jgi:hypothetical protein
MLLANGLHVNIFYAIVCNQENPARRAVGARRLKAQTPARLEAQLNPGFAACAGSPGALHTPAGAAVVR